MPGSSDREIALAQFIKTKRAEVRLTYSLMADAEIARMVPAWRDEFNVKGMKNEPVVLDLASEARRRLGDGS